MKTNIKLGRQLTLSTLFLFETILGFSQTKNLSLKDAINLSIKNSGQLKIDKAKVDEALANVKEAEDRKLPEASITSSYLRLNSPNVDLKVKVK